MHLATTMADLPPGTVLTFDRARARSSDTLPANVYSAEMWTVDGARYRAAVECAHPPSLHDLIAHAQELPEAWILRPAN